MKIIGSLSIFVILAVLIVFQPIAFSASSSSDDGPTEDELYQAYSDIYFMKREINQSIEMAVRESFLKWLYNGIVSEVRLRKNLNPNLTLDALNPSGLQGYTEDSYKLPENIEDSPPHIAYPIYEKYDRDEYNHKYLQARLIKEKLIVTANSEQRKRMFNNDLTSSIYTYIDGYYTEAVLKFDELIKEYGFDNLEDIFFYRGESYFAMNLEQIAIKDFERVVSTPNVDSLYHKTALNRLITLYGNMGDQEKVKQYWNTFNEAYSNNTDDEYWEVLELVGRYLMLAGDLSEAKLLFDQIPQSNHLFIPAQLLAAKTSLMQLDLDDAERRFRKLEVSKFGINRVSKAIRNEAKLKIGYISFLRGEYGDAYTKFSEVKGNTKFSEIALISSAWSLFRLNEFENVITICNSFVTQFPNSKYHYEAIALMGHCREVIGQGTIAVDLFQEIMTAVDDRQDYRDFVYEKRQISKISVDLKMIESEVFGQNKRELFKRYLSVREKLYSLKQKVWLAEGIKANPEIQEMIVEQARLIKIIEGQQELEAILDSSEDRKSRNKYQSILTDLSELTFQVSSAIRYELSRSNITQREEKNRHEALMSDSLKQRTLREIRSIDRLLERVSEFRSNIGKTVDPHMMIDLTAINDDLQNMRNKLLQVQKNLSGFGQAELTSNLDEWSDFACLRYTYGGLDFDNFSAQQDRLVILDTYMQKLSKFLADRNWIDDDTTKLADNLILASGAGEAPYKAPPIPMWGDEVVEAAPSVKPLPVDDAILDTSVIDGSMDSEMMPESSDGGGDLQETEAIESEDEIDSIPVDGESPLEGEVPVSVENEGNVDQPTEEQTGQPAEEMDSDGGGETSDEEVEQDAEIQPAQDEESFDSNDPVADPESSEEPPGENQSNDTENDVPVEEPEKEPSKEDPTQP